jgi:hypothetical protein
MSTVRPFCMNSEASLCYAARPSLRRSFRAGTLVSSPPAGLGTQFARAVRPSAAGAPPALFPKRAAPSCSCLGLLVKQSTQNRAFFCAQCCRQEQLATSGPRRASHFARHQTRWCADTCSLTLAAKIEGISAHRSWRHRPRPNPSIEGTHKRLRLLRSPHVKR